MGKTSLSGPLYVGGQYVASAFPTQGNVWHVKPGTGSDGNSGKNADEALATLGEALTLATANQNDVIFLYAESNTAASTTNYLSATLTWNKDLVHLIGVCAPSAVSQRARIAQTSTATGVAPLVNVTANGCIFKNFSIFHGVADATSLVALQVTGSRNYFENVHIAGIGDATMVVANAASLKIDGGAENVFKNCVIGLDTISCDNSTKGEIWLDTAATRNKFEDCLIQRYISNAGYVHVTVQDSTGIDRWLHFKNCLFLTESVNDTITQTGVFSIAAATDQGYIILENCFILTPGASGSGDWDANNRGKIYTTMPAIVAAGAGGYMTKQ